MDVKNVLLILWHNNSLPLRGLSKRHSSRSENSLLCERFTLSRIFIHWKIFFSHIRGKSRAFDCAGVKTKARVKRSIWKLEWKSESFHEALGKNPVPNSSQDLITVIGGRREKSFSLSFRGLGGKNGKLIFLTQKHFSSGSKKVNFFRLPETRFFSTTFEVAFSEQENFVIFSLYNMMSSRVVLEIKIFIGVTM